MRRVPVSLRLLFLSLLIVGGSFAGGYAYQALSRARPAAADTAATPVAPPRVVSDLEDALVAAARSARPAVVSISTEHRVHVPGRRHPFSENPFFDDPFFGRVWPQISPHDENISGLGSGFLITADGVIVTNAHVVAAPEGGTATQEKITVRLADGREREAAVVGTDKTTDIAVLRIEHHDGETFPTVPLGNSDELEIGHIVLVIGTPFDRKLSQTVTMGIVSAKGRTGLGIEAFEDFIQTDAAINPGNSGGPMINLKGEVVGMSTAITTRSGDYAGVGFAIPSNLIRFVQASLIEGKPVRRGFLGVSVQDLTEEMSQELGAGVAAGAVVSDVVAGSPAARAGIEAGDVIVRWNGREIRSARELTAAVSSTTIGSRARVVARRGGEEMTWEVEVAERPGAAPAPEGEEATPTEGRKIKALGARVRESEEGLVITAIDENTPLAGKVEPGAVILAVGRQRVRTIAELEEAIRGKSRALLLLQDGRTRIHLLIPLAE